VKEGISAMNRIMDCLKVESGHGGNCKFAIDCDCEREGFGCELCDSSHGGDCDRERRRVSAVNQFVKVDFSHGRQL
jgi:hypothetical protein